MKYISKFLIFKLLLTFYVFDADTTSDGNNQLKLCLDKNTMNNLTLEMVRQSEIIENLSHSIELVKSQNHLEVLRELTPLYHFTLLIENKTSKLLKEQYEFFELMAIKEQGILDDVKKSLEARELKHFNELENIIELTISNKTEKIQTSINENRIAVEVLSDKIHSIELDIKIKVDEILNELKSSISNVQSKVDEQVKLIKSKLSEVKPDVLTSLSKLKKIDTPDKLEYQFQSAGGGLFKFKVRAANDAHLALVTYPHDLSSIYEVYIGGWMNSKSAIRKNNQTDVVKVPTPGILGACEFRGFWIRWSKDEISVGREEETTAFMSYQAQDMFTVNYIGIRTGWGAIGTWFIEEEEEVL